MNFYKLYIGDYQRDTGTLTLAEHGAYALMLQYFYATEAPLPTGRDLHRLLRADTPAERKAIDAVASRFWRETDDGLINDRALEEIRKGSHQRDVNREIGARGGRPKQTESVSESVSKTATESKTESVSESVTKSEPNRNPNHSQTPDTKEKSPLKGAKKESSSVASRLPDDWVLPAEWRQWAEAERPGIDATETAAIFADYWHGIGGKEGRKLDWLGTWRNWVRRERMTAKTPSPRSATSGSDTPDILADPHPQWALDAGFASRFEAENADCFRRNAAQFRNGKRIPVEAPR